MLSNCWIEMGDAPRDGTIIDLFVVDGVGAKFRVPKCKWGIPDDVLGDETWLERRRSDEDPARLAWSEMYHHPTHYMLIEPPSPSNKSELQSAAVVFRCPEGFEALHKGMELSASETLAGKLDDALKYAASQ